MPGRCISPLSEIYGSDASQPIHNQLDSFPLIFTRSDEMLVCMVMNSLPLAFEGDLSVSMDKSLARRNVENKSLGAAGPTGASASLSPDLNQLRFMI